YREVDELALVVHALATDVFVAVVLGPRLLRFLELAADAVTAHVGEHRAHPVIEHARLQLKADPEADGLIIHTGDERERVVATEKSPLEEIDFTFWAKAR